jgi:hypothetical protein
MSLLKSKLNDKYNINYKYLLTYSSNKFTLINNILLYNFLYNDNNNICNISLNQNNNIYNILFKENRRELFTKIKYINYYYNNYIIDKYTSNDTLLITNTTNILKNYYLLKQKKNMDVIYYYNSSFSSNDRQLKLDKSIPKYYDMFDTIYNIFDINNYKQFLIHLKNKRNQNNEENNIYIPQKKYNMVSCIISYYSGLSLTASYMMTLKIPNIISTIAMAIKNIAKDGTLLLFWSIVNINIPIIKKILSVLSYGFKTVEIINNDINQNLLIGVPEYYIKCSGYKNNITHDLINKLLDIAIKSIEYNYPICDILDYYEDYTEQHSNNSLFYNKTEDTKSRNKNINKYTKTKKQSSSSKSFTRKSTKSNKIITPIYYIEDINIPELDEIMKDKTLMFKVDTLANKLEGLFVGYFEMVNNLIVNAIATDKKGNMYVKPSAILQKDITNLTKLITMFEYNKLPYNKHALKVLLKKKDEVVEHFYSLDKPINHKFIKYNDRNSKSLRKHALDRSYKNNKKYTKSKKSNTIYDTNILSDYYQKIKLALQVKNKLLEEIGLVRAPKNVRYNIYDFGSGLSDFINMKYKKLPSKIDMEFLKLWEILHTFRLIPESSIKCNILHLYEASQTTQQSQESQQIIMSAQYWSQTKCPNLKSEHVNLYSNTINNIKSIIPQLSKTKLDLIICNSNSLLSLDDVHMQKLNIEKIISIIIVSSIGGACCVKHTIPYRNMNDTISTRGEMSDSNNSIDSNWMFISYLYLYYITFNTISLYKPNTSFADNGEFYVIGKGFLGIEEDSLNNLYKFLDTFQLNDTIIPRENIPKTFIIQVNNFLNDMSNLNILSIEKQNLLLTCFKSQGENVENIKNVNEILNCNQFLNEKSIDKMIIPKYKEWINIFNFE